MPTPLGTTQDQRRDALALTAGKKWQSGRVLRVWLDTEPRLADRVKPYFLEWTQYANLSFEFVENRPLAEIRVGFVAGDGSWSYLGTDILTIPQSEYTMNLGWVTIDESEVEVGRVTRHEVGHALGCIHEHQNPSGGIPWDRDAVLAYYRGAPNYWDDATIEHNIFRRYSESQSNFTDFDRLSIMAYPVPNAFTTGDYYVPFNVDLSDGDKQFIGWMYPKAEEPKPATPETMSKSSFNKLSGKHLRGRDVDLTYRNEKVGHFKGVDAE